MTLAKLPINPRGIRVLKSIETERLKANWPDSAKLPPSPKQCITCKGTKTFKWLDPDSLTSTVEYECPCIDQWIMHRFFLYNGIGLNYQRIGWVACYADTVAKQAVHNYLSDRFLANNLEVGNGLFLYNKGRGTGKTLLSTLLLRRTLAEGHTGHFTTFLEMLDAYTDAWKDQEKSDWYQSKIRNATVLVIDYPGKEMSSGNATEMARTILDDVIRHRMSASMPTIITSNDTPDEFKLRYGGNVDSLISERMLPVLVGGDDFRPNMYATSQQEMEMGLTRPIVVG